MIKKIKRLVAGITPSWLINLWSAYQLRANPYYKRIDKLEINRSGIAEDGTPYVELANSRIFYGYLPSLPQKYFYKYFLRGKIKDKLHVECINVAFDIVVRYLGPELASNFIGQGKFYGFAKGDTVVEAGAYIGYYVMRAAELVGQDGKVVAIEAVDENLQLLRKNIEANKFQNVVVVPKAVWNSTGSLKFYRNARQQASAISTVVTVQDEFDVACDTIDNIVKAARLEKVNFIRIQVNGVEREALAGTSETLKQSPILLIAAIYERDGVPSWKEIKTTLEDYGYATQVEKGNILAVKTK
jgi:FkbM family methyltransferase